MIVLMRATDRHVEVRLDTVIHGVDRDLDKTQDGDLRDLIVRIRDHLDRTRSTLRVHNKGVDRDIESMGLAL
jgi:hypothetical protein